MILLLGVAEKTADVPMCAQLRAGEADRILLFKTRFVHGDILSVFGRLFSVTKSPGPPHLARPGPTLEFLQKGIWAKGPLSPGRLITWNNASNNIASQPPNRNPDINCQLKPVAKVSKTSNPKSEARINATVFRISSFGLRI